ncbi:hypothetical protein KI387_002181, partial [Taxus chinensis]
MNRVLEKYQNFSASTGHCTQLSENKETLCLEVDNLKKRISHLEKNNKEMIGEELDFLHYKDLRHLEKKLNLSVGKIRSKKDKIFLERIRSLKAKQRSLKEENDNFREKNGRTQVGRSHKEPNNNNESMDGVNREFERDGATQQHLRQTTLNL